MLGNGSYANAGILASVLSNIGRVDRFASIDLGGHSFNSSSYGGKQTVNTTLTDKDENVYSPDASEVIAVNRAFNSAHATVYTVIILLPPVILLVLGVVMRVKRRNL